MKKALLLAAFALAACNSGSGPSKYDQTQVAVTPKGSISIRVLDASTLNPLDGVSVKVLGGDPATLTTNADGVCVFADAVVSSTYFFIVEKAGYLRNSTSASLSASAGNSPLAGPVTVRQLNLYKADGEIRGYVFLPDGKPAASATVIDYQNSYGESVLTTTTAMDGSFKLSGVASLPNGAGHTVYALWFDENADGNADYGTVGQSTSVYPGTAARMFLTYSNVGQRILASNIIDNEAPANEDLSFTFSLPLLPYNVDGNANRAYVLTNQTRGGVEVAVSPTWTSVTQLSLHPAAPLNEGDRYRIVLSLTNASAGSNNASANFGQTINFQVRPANATGISSQVRNLTVTNPNPSATQSLTQFNWNTNSFQVSFDGVTGAYGYLVYAKDTNLNPNYVQVGSLSQLTPRVSTTIGLPSSFDPSGTGSARPLSFGNKVTFTVVPVDVYGNFAPLSAAPTVQVSDNVAPGLAGSPLNLTYPTGTVDAINDDPSVPTIIQFRVAYNEPMDQAAANVPTFVTSGSGFTQAFVWDQFNNSGSSGLLTLTVQPNGDISGPFIIRGGKDFAGNAIALGSEIASSLSGRKELLTNPGFEDSTGNCTTTGWTLTPTSGALAPASIAGAGRTSRCAMLLGAPAGGAPQTGSSKIQQDVALPMLPTNVPATFELKGWARATFFGPAAATASQNCELRTTSDTLISSLFANSNANQNSFSSNSTGASASMGMTVRIVCEVNNTATMSPANAAMYVDDISLAKVITGTY